MVLKEIQFQNTKMPARTRQIRAGKAGAGETGGETIDPAPILFVC